ncbi:MAG: hypothetical protein P8M80_08195 [Pirellulaceae bacterium]|nr:hypothetical protein [Pirellulaceae bacterium]
MYPLPEESRQRIQEILELSVDETNRKTPAYREGLRSLLNANITNLAPVFATISPFVNQVSKEFLEDLSAECERAMGLTGNTLDDSVLTYVEDFLLRGHPANRWNWLTVLAYCQTPAGLDVFVRELLESPPVDSATIMKAFAPLMRKPQFDVDWLFPELFAGIHRAELAPIIFDFSNFCVREGLTSEHPASEKAAEFLILFQSLVKRMQDVEADPTAWSGDANQISKMIMDSVALIVSLCDTFSLVGYEPAVNTLQIAATIRHRRIRTEAAFTLAKLGDPGGGPGLLELVQEPVCRLRVIEYANELGISDQIPDEFVTPQALAASELALWLAQPSQMGIPPTIIELREQQTFYWPGYDEPVDCFLLQYEYQLGENSLTNIAMTGPMVHAFSANLTHLKPAEIFSAFAGWDAEHEEIFELDMESLTTHRQTDRFKLERKMQDFGCSEIRIGLMAVFFGEILAVANCQFDDQPHIVFADGNEVDCFPVGSNPPITISEGYSIYKGRKLLAAFNA